MPWRPDQAGAGVTDTRVLAAHKYRISRGTGKIGRLKIVVVRCRRDRLRAGLA